MPNESRRCCVRPGFQEQLAINELSPQHSQRPVGPSLFFWGGGGDAGCYGNGGVREAVRDGVCHREEWGQRGVTGVGGGGTGRTSGNLPPPDVGIPLGATPR